MMSSSLVIPKHQNLESIPGDLCKTYFKIQTVAAVGGNLHNWKFAQIHFARWDLPSLDCNSEAGGWQKFAQKSSLAFSLPLSLSCAWFILFFANDQLMVSWVIQDGNSQQFNLASHHLTWFAFWSRWAWTAAAGLVRFLGRWAAAGVGNGRDRKTSKHRKPHSPQTSITSIQSVVRFWSSPATSLLN